MLLTFNSSLTIHMLYIDNLKKCLLRLEEEKTRTKTKVQAETQTQVKDEISRILSAERTLAQDSLQQAIIRERLATEDEKRRAELFVSLCINCVEAGGLLSRALIDSHDHFQTAPQCQKRVWNWRHWLIDFCTFKVILSPWRTEVKRFCHSRQVVSSRLTNVSAASALSFPWAVIWKQTRLLCKMLRFMF